MSFRRSFASDNYAGVHPEVMAALARAIVGHQVAYGDDEADVDEFIASLKTQVATR